MVIQAKAKPEQHLDRKTVGRAFELEEREPVNSFAGAKRSEDHAHSNECQCQAVEGAKFQRRFVAASVLCDCHLPLPKGCEMVRSSIVLQMPVFVDNVLEKIT